MLGGVLVERERLRVLPVGWFAWLYGSDGGVEYIHRKSLNWAFQLFGVGVNMGSDDDDAQW